MNSVKYILIDMDEVLADFGKGVEEASGVRDCDRTTFYLTDEPSVSSTISGVIKVNAILAKPGFSETLSPIDGAFEALEEMLSMTSIEPLIVTSPNRLSLSNYSDKARWTRRNLGADWLERLIITPIKTAVIGDILIDDKPNRDQTEKFFEPMWTQVLFRTYHNRDYWDSMPSCNWNNWKDVVLPLLGQ